MTQGSTPPPVPVIPVYASGPGYWAGPRRPWQITAIGVVSIVIGSLALLFNAVLLLHTAGTAWLVSTQASMVTTPAPLPPDAPTRIVGNEFLGEDGLAAPQRERILAGLNSVRSLSSERRARVDELLKVSGAKVFGAESAALTPEQIAGMITQHGRLPPATPGPSQDRDYFSLDRGRLEVGDESAVLYPADGGTPVRSMWVAMGPQWMGNPTVLSPAQRQAVLQVVQEQADGVSAMQLDAMDVAMAASWQSVVTPQDTVEQMRAQVRSVTVETDGTVVVSTDLSRLRLTPDGLAYEYGSIVGLAQGASAPSASMAALVLAVGEAVVSGLLGIGLLGLGILTLRQSQRGGWWHWVYVWIKLPLALAAVAIWAWFYHDMLTAVWASSKPPEMWTIVIGACYGALGLVWPLVLILLLRSRGVREYYATGG